MRPNSPSSRESGIEAEEPPDVTGGVEGIHATVVTCGRLLVHERQVVTDCHDPRGVGDRAVAGHHRLDAEIQHQVAGRDPVRQGPGPHDRRAADEQDVTGVDRGAVGNVDDRVAGGVGRADLDQLDAAAAHVEIETALEHSRRWHEFDALEAELAEERPEQVADLAGRLIQRSQHRRGNVGHLLGRRDGGDDLHPGPTPRDLTVAVAVVTVGMGVHHGVDRRPVGDRCQRVQHRGRQLEIEQGVDQQRLAVADDQPGVAPAPSTIGLQVGETTVPEFVHPRGEVSSRHGTHLVTTPSSAR